MVRLPMLIAAAMLPAAAIAERVVTSFDFGVSHHPRPHCHSFVVRPSAAAA
jgi:hypothetical protein